MSNNIKVTEDGFAWLIVTNKAEIVFGSGSFELYALHTDGTESLIHNMDELKHAKVMNDDIGIEVGQLTKENLYPFFKSLTKRLK